MWTITQLCLQVKISRLKNLEHINTHYKDKEASVLRIFGVNAVGNSVMAHVHNFTPYFYVGVDTTRVSLMPDDLMKI